jgi:hypothetical protein
MYFDIDSQFLISLTGINQLITYLDFDTDIDDKEVIKTFHTIDKELYHLQNYLDKNYPDWDDKLHDITKRMESELEKFNYND